MAEPFDLVIFDCDGVLIDSEGLSCAIEAEVLTEFGFPLTPEEVRDSFVGLSLARELDLIAERFGRRPSDEVVAAIHARNRSVFAASLQPTPGIHDLLDRLTLPRCVASSSAPERLRFTLGLTGLYDRLQPHIFSATMVKNGKPAPDLFLYAAAAMKADPAQCLVIEDSAVGVAAGKAAGMTVVGFTGGSHCAPGHGDKLYTAGADRVVAQIGEVNGIVDIFSAI